MSIWIAVALGGALGSIARHGVNRWVHQAWPLLQFPAATLIVNVVGCGAIGTLAALVASGRLPMGPFGREFVFVGLLGGFTTFSTFGLDTMTLVRAGALSQAFLNVALHVIVGLGIVFVSYAAVDRLLSAAR
jgi:CrcB protein